MSDSFKDVDPLRGLSSMQMAAAQQRLGNMGAALSRPARKTVEVQPWIRQRSGRFGDVGMLLTLDSEDRLAALQLNGSLHDQEALRGLIGFLQELVK